MLVAVVVFNHDVEMHAVVLAVSGLCAIVVGYGYVCVVHVRLYAVDYMSGFLFQSCVYWKGCSP